MSIGGWDPIVESFTSRFRVIRCDFRGQLLSPFPSAVADPTSGSRPYSIDDHVADVVELLDHLRAGPVHVAGTSFGGEVAMALAAEHPRRVTSLCVVTATDRLTAKMRAAAKALESLARAAAAGGDGGIIFSKIAPNTFSEQWLAAQPADFIEARARQFSLLPAAFYDGVASLMFALLTLDLDAKLPAIEAPALVIGADLDRTFPIEHSHAIAAAIPGARLEILGECGHGAVVEAPARIARLLLEFVSSVEGGRG